VTAPGDRIILIHMGDDPCPIEPGATGTVFAINDGPLAQMLVNWDNGRHLALIPGVDVWETLSFEVPS
jgi:hypothetical protein